MHTYTLKKVLLFCTLFFSITAGFAQKTDTVLIDGNKVNTSVLRPGVHRYLVYFKNGRDSSRKNYQVWTRSIDFIKYEGRDAISITQVWEDNDSVTHKVYSINDRKTFRPLFHDSWWRKSGAMKFDFITNKAFIKDEELSDADTSRLKKNVWGAFKTSLNQYFLNWHLDLETFPILPYKENTTFMINFYDPGFGPPKLQAYTVAESGSLTGYDNQKIDCWLLTHASSATNKETFWISKKTKEVLKLEQEFNGRFRYKIKFGYSD